jgi:hypothetical protein
VEIRGNFNGKLDENRIWRSVKAGLSGSCLAEHMVCLLIVCIISREKQAHLSSGNISFELI